MMKTFLIIALALVAALPCSAAVFQHTFENEDADAGSPMGFSTFGHELADRGVTKQTSAEGDQSAYVVADFGLQNWGVILIRDADRWDLRGATLSVQVRASSNFVGKQPVVAFKLIDEDGTGYRTAARDLGSVNTDWTTFSQNVSLLVPDEEQGEDPGLDLENIVQYAVIFFDQQDHNKVVTFYVDDFKAVTGGE